MIQKYNDIWLLNDMIRYRYNNRIIRYEWYYNLKSDDVYVKSQEPGNLVPEHF